VIQSVQLAGLKIMMGHRQVEQAALFYEFSLENRQSRCSRHYNEFLRDFFNRIGPEANKAQAVATSAVRGRPDIADACL